MNYLKLISLISLTLFVSACSTRQAGERFTGATEQRLVTYSIRDMAKEMAKEPISVIRDKAIVFESHFVIHNQVQLYAEERIKTELIEKYNVRFVDADDPNASYKLKFFFTSLGTDRDQAGFSLPIINLAEPERSTSISLLAVDMYHGIAECNYFLEDLTENRLLKTGKINARVKTDKFTTPIFGFPISDIDD